MGECSKENAFAILDAFYENGGNFIDTYVFDAASISMTVADISQSQQLSVRASRAMARRMDEGSRKSRPNRVSAEEFDDKYLINKHVTNMITFSFSLWH